MKILVVRFSSIGDIILTSPVVRCLSAQLGAQVHFLTKSSYANLLHYNPNIARVYTMTAAGLDSTLITSLRHEGYDHIVDLHKNIRSRKLIARLGIPSTNFSKANLEKWLLVNLKFDRMPKAHIVQRYFQAVGALGVTYDGEGLDFYIDPKTECPIPPRPFIAFAIGAAHATKRLPHHQIQEICRQIKYPVALLGGPSENEIGLSLASSSSHVHNFCGQTTLQESAKLIQASSLVLTHDTGMMHLAAALKKPIISIWGSTVPAFGMYPFYPDAATIFEKRFEIADLPCRPCSKLGHSRCPKKHFRCMENQDIPEIIKTSNEFLSKQNTI